IISMIFLTFLISCGEKEPEYTEVKPDFNNQDFVLEQAKKTLGDNVEFAYSGLFDSDSVLDVSAGTEIVNKDIWGIKFFLLKINNEKLETEYESDLLEGSFNECLIQKIKFPSFPYELIYYNSLDYYLGSGGGEVFSYIVDLNEKEIFYAHLIAEPDQPVSLFLSENITNNDVKNLFISNFKRDYPTLKVVTSDVDLKY